MVTIATLTWYRHLVIITAISYMRHLVITFIIRVVVDVKFSMSASLVPFHSVRYLLH